VRIVAVCGTACGYIVCDTQSDLVAVVPMFAHSLHIEIECLTCFANQLIVSL
jgi:hypothetical protein